MQHHFALCFEGQLSDQLRHLDAPVANLGRVRLRNPIPLFGARLRLKRMLRAAPPDVVVSHDPWAQAALGPAIRLAARQFQIRPIRENFWGNIDRVIARRYSVLAK
jgi:hypothetical protein